jgi:hypothetical protein
VTRPRHPRKELEALLKEAENQGWTVQRGGRYFKLKCGCPAKHFTTLHLSPSDPRYERNKRHWLARMTCWKEQG